MPIQQRTDIDEITITGAGPILVKMMKTVENDGVVLFAEPHRVSIEPGVSAEAVLAAVTTHLEAMGYPAPDTTGPLTPSDIIATVRAQHTPARIAAYRGRFPSEPGRPA